MIIKFVLYDETGQCETVLVKDWESWEVGQRVQWKDVVYIVRMISKNFIEEIFEVTAQKAAFQNSTVLKGATYAINKEAVE